MVDRDVAGAENFQSATLHLPGGSPFSWADLTPPRLIQVAVLYGNSHIKNNRVHPRHMEPV